MVLASEFESVDKGQFNYYVNSFLPAFVQIPFEEGDELLVSAGDSVSEGQLIIKGKKYTSHAPLPGTVTEIVEFEKDDGLHRALKIKLSGEFKFTGKNLTPASW
ncbi:MAG: hypothetical protein J6Y93_02605, partial [Treponema sp.]|nr:hypothetical protein [Treponema sp.]